MKLLAVSLLFAVAGAQASVCSYPQVKQEAQTYLKTYAETDGQFRVVTDCLKQEITQMMRGPLQINAETEQFLVGTILQNVTQILKDTAMTAQVKCESTGTPGCGDSVQVPEELFSAQDLKELDAEADAKRLSPVEDVLD